MILSSSSDVVSSVISTVLILSSEILSFSNNLFSAFWFSSFSARIFSVEFVTFKIVLGVGTGFFLERDLVEEDKDSLALYPRG